MRDSVWVGLRVVFVTLLSTLSTLAAAHEVLPSIGDMEVVGDRLEFRIEGSFEGFVAGLDLEGLEDTNAAEGVGDYDALRALPAAEFEARLRAFWPQMAEEMSVLVDGQAVDLQLDGVAVAYPLEVDGAVIDDTSVARPSVITFSGALPDGAQTMQIDWPARYGTLVLRQMGVEEGWDGYLTGGLSEEVDLKGGQQMSGWQAFGRYIPVGVEHIIPLGLDHILFVLGLFFLSTQLRPLLFQVTAFTAAHTISLALAALGYVNVPGSIVEPVIAASIVYVAVENVFARGLNPWRPAIIFVFGLLHGLGFASVLGEYVIPEDTFIPALLGFNVGVEVGQLIVITVAFLVVVAAMRLSEDGKENRLAAAIYLVVAVVAIPLLLIPISTMGADAVDAFLPILFMIATLAGLSAASCAVERYETYRHMVAMPASIGIALVGAYWIVERVFL